MNENKPDNPFMLMSYLGRDQYPKGPVVYGEFFGADYDIVEKDYWARMGKRYVKGTNMDVSFAPGSKMIFPSSLKHGTTIESFIVSPHL